MSTDPSTNPAGKHCRLKAQLRAANGIVYQTTEPYPVIVRQSINLDRVMLLIRFPDDATAFVFPDEVDILDE